MSSKCVVPAYPFRGVLASAVLIAIGAAPTAAQQAAETVPLPPVTVEAQQQKPKQKKKAAAKKAPSQSAAQVSPTPQAPSQQQQPKSETDSYQGATGPVDGFVAKSSATGTKTGTPLMETPQSISVVPKDQVEQQGADSVSEALHYTAGVIVDVRPASRYDIVNIRGLGNLQSFVHFQDGLRLQRGLNFDVPVVDPYLLERIEVLKGPASVLYGQVAVGGLVNFVSKKPEDEPFGEVSVTYGSHDRKQVAFDFGGPIDKDGEFSYRLTGLARDTGTDIYGVDEERYAFAPSFTWRPSTATTLTILASIINDPESSYSVGVPALGSGLPSPNGQIPDYFNPGDPSYDRFRREQASAGYLFEHHFDQVWTVRQNFRYMSLDTEFMALQTSGISGTNISRNASNTINSVDTYAIDNQVEAKFATGAVKHTLLAGFDYQSASADAKLGSGSGPAIDYLNPVYGQPVTRPAITQRVDGESDQTGVYIQEQLKLGRFVGVIGGRYDWADYDLTQRTASTLKVSQHDEDFTWRAGAIYEFDNGIAPYFSYATSFEPITGTALDYEGKPFKPTTGEQYEIGAKYQPVGINALFTVALFDMTLQNVLTTDADHQFNVPTAGARYPCAQAANQTCQSQAGEMRSRGVELEARASLNKNLDVVGAYTYVDAKYTKSNTLMGGISEVGKRPTAVPEHMASFWAYYTFHETALNGFGFGGGVRYISDTYGNRTNTWKVDAVTLFDAAASYDLGVLGRAYDGYSVQLNVQNVFDELYLASCGPFGGGFPATSATNSGCYYGAGRNVMATLKYEW